MIEQIAQCEALPDIWRALVAYFRDQGFDGVCYSAYGQGDVVANPQLLVHGFTAEQIDAYLSADHRRLDIVPRLSLAQGRPLRWREAWETADTSEEERKFLALMQATELGDGYCLPCYGPFGRNGFIGVGRMKEDSARDDVLIRQMHIIAQAAHMRICALALRDNAPDRALSAREKEILDWVARGKSNSVIAEILNISAGTVDTYLRRIYEKLGVSDRTSAAVRGIGMGLIAA
jgi:DNA-binding CsgD family transcriptional regulator